MRSVHRTLPGLRCDFRLLGLTLPLPTPWQKERGNCNKEEEKKNDKVKKSQTPWGGGVGEIKICQGVYISASN